MKATTQIKSKWGLSFHGSVGMSTYVWRIGCRATALQNLSCTIRTNISGTATALRPMGKASVSKTIASAWLIRSQLTSFCSRISWTQNLKVTKRLQITRTGILSGQKSSMNLDKRTALGSLDSVPNTTWTRKAWPSKSKCWN